MDSKYADQKELNFLAQLAELFLGNGSNYLILTDTKGRIFYINEPLQLKLGLVETPDSIFSLLNTTDELFVTRQISSVINESDASFPINLSSNKKDFHFHCQASLLSSNHSSKLLQSLELIALVLTDKSIELELLRELTQTKDQFLDYIESVKHPVLIVDDNFIIKSLNNNAKQLFRLNNTDLVNNSIFKYLEPEESRTLQTALISIQDNGQLDDFNLQIKDTGFKLTGWLDSNLFILNLKPKSEQLFPKQLQKIASHQFRTPLTTIGWHLELLKSQDDLSPELKEFIETLEAAQLKLKQNIDKFLLYLQIENNQVQVTKADFDLVKYLQAKLKETHNLFKQYEPKLELHTSGITNLRVITDSNILDLILYELLSNSILYNSSQTRGIDLHIIDEQNKIKLDIIDNGIEIAESESHNIFKKFTRLHSGESIYTDGSGLGLYIAQKLAILLGGNLKLTSLSPKTFTLTIPK